MKTDILHLLAGLADTLRAQAQGACPRTRRGRNAPGVAVDTMRLPAYRFPVPSFKREALNLITFTSALRRRLTMRNRLILALALTVAIVAILALPVERGAARTTLTTSASCLPLGDGSHLECTAYPSGGVPPYTYDWTPNPAPGYYDEYWTVVPCSIKSYNPVHQYYIYQASVTVTDSYGATASTTAYTTSCGGAP